VVLAQEEWKDAAGGKGGKKLLDQYNAACLAEALAEDGLL
jgi:hypothetical protein